MNKSVYVGQCIIVNNQCWSAFAGMRGIVKSVNEPEDYLSVRVRFPGHQIFDAHAVAFSPKELDRK